MVAKTKIITLLIIAFFQIGSSIAQFTDVLAGYGIVITDNSSLYGSAVSFADFNGDGWDDLSVGTTDQAPKFFINNAGNGFSAVNFSAIPSTSNQVNMILWADYDNDGDRDLLMSIDDGNLQFYRNDGDLNLVNITAESGLNVEPVNNYGAGWGDINNDGLLDLYLCRYSSQIDSGYNHENRLFKQLDDGTFEDITISAAVTDGIKSSFQPLFWDYDLDGFQDIFIINDRQFASNSMYRNLGNETFEDVSLEIGLSQTFDAMSLGLGDYDNDQDMDLFISNNTGNYLNRNNGNGSFTNVGNTANVLGMVTCWGSVWLDYDNNGYLDLYVGTAPLNTNLTSPSFFYENQGDGTFSNIIGGMGLASDIRANHAVAQGDYNRDGREDFLVGVRAAKAKLYKNENPQALENNWISCSFEGQISNRDAIGTSFKVYCQDDVYTRYTLCGESYISQSSFNKHIGINDHSIIDSLYIKWPRGLEEVYHNLPVNSYHHFIEGATLASNFQFEDSLFICPGTTLLFEIPENDFSSILWSNGAEDFSIEITDLGDYSATLVHQSGIIVQTDTFHIDFYNNIILDFATTNPTCFGGSDGSFDMLNPTDDVTSLFWLNLGEGVSFDQLDAGVYFYEGYDGNACFIAGEISLQNPEELIMQLNKSPLQCYGALDASASLITNNEELIEIISWSNGDQGFIADSLSAGSHSFQVIDTLGCVYDEQFFINQVDEFQVEIVSDISSNSECLNSYLLSFNSAGGVEPVDVSWTIIIGEDEPITITNEDFYDCLPFGNVILNLQDANGCETQVSGEFEMLIDVEESQRNALNFYPNPNSGLLYFDEAFSGIPYRVYNSFGQVLSAGILEGGQLLLNNYSPGIYFIETEQELISKFSFIIE